MLYFYPFGHPKTGAYLKAGQALFVRGADALGQRRGPSSPLSAANSSAHNIYLVGESQAFARSALPVPPNRICIRADELISSRSV